MSGGNQGSGRGGRALFAALLLVGLIAAAVLIYALVNPPAAA
jgi:hypothetical protein